MPLPRKFYEYIQIRQEDDGHYTSAIRFNKRRIKDKIVMCSGMSACGSTATKAIDKLVSSFDEKSLLDDSTTDEIAFFGTYNKGVTQ